MKSFYRMFLFILVPIFCLSETMDVNIGNPRVEGSRYKFEVTAGQVWGIATFILIIMT